MFGSREMSQFIQDYLPSTEAQGLGETSRSVRGAVGSDRKIEEGIRRVYGLLRAAQEQAAQANDFEDALSTGPPMGKEVAAEMYAELMRLRNASVDLLQRAQQGISRIRHWIAGTDPARRSRRLRLALPELDLAEDYIEYATTGGDASPEEWKRERDERESKEREAQEEKGELEDEQDGGY